MDPINDPLLCGYLHDIFDFNESDIRRFPKEIYPMIHKFLTISSAELAALFNGGDANLRVLKKEGDGFKEYKPEEALAGADVIAIFFSGHWCPPSRRFTPILTENYAKWKAKGNKVEVVFVSSDRNKESMESYFKEMGDWVSYKYREGKFQSRKYGITGIPTLVVMDAGTGELITENGRSDVRNNEEKAAEIWIAATKNNDKEQNAE